MGSRESGDARDDHLTDPFGNGQRLHRQARLGHVAQDLPDEERVPLRPLVQRRRQCPGDRAPGYVLQESGQLVDTQPFEGDAVDSRGASQVGEDAAQGVAGADLGVAKCGHHEQPRWSRGAQHVGEQMDGR